MPYVVKNGDIFIEEERLTHMHKHISTTWSYRYRVLRDVGGKISLKTLSQS